MNFFNEKIIIEQQLVVFKMKFNLAVEKIV